MAQNGSLPERNPKQITKDQTQLRERLNAFAAEEAIYEMGVSSRI